MLISLSQSQAIEPVGGYTTESVPAIEPRRPMVGTNLYCLVNIDTLCVNNLARLEPATSRLQVPRPNHYAATPHKLKSIGILEIEWFVD